jgi:hypothetical protein
VSNKLPGGIPLKLKSLAVITLLVLGCSAAFAQGSFTLGFLNYGGTFLYCNYEIAQYGGPNNFYIQGTDNLENGCFQPNNATFEGVKVNVRVSDGSPVYGTNVYAYADNLLDAFGEYYSSEQWFVLTQTKPSKFLHRYGWAGYLGFYGYEFLDNYGYLSASIPGSAPQKPVASIHTAANAKNSPVKTKTIQ